MNYQGKKTGNREKFFKLLGLFMIGLIIVLLIILLIH